MTQEILTFVILAGAAGYVVYLLWKRFRPGRKSPCEGCMSQEDCGGCEVKDWLREQQKMRK
jgi:hypothetical protein